MKRIEDIKQILVSCILQFILNFLMRTNRWEVHGEAHLHRAGPRMLCTWHNRLAMVAWFVKRSGLKPYAVASRSKDGEIISRIIESWGFRPMRGSSSRGGKAVLVQMAKVLKQGELVAVTNDGPRGPAKLAKPGSVGMAKKFNAQLIAVSATATRYWQFNSWDKFRLPKPFGKIIVHVAAPMEYSDDKLEPTEESARLSAYINANEATGDALV